MSYSEHASDNIDDDVLGKHRLKTCGDDVAELTPRREQHEELGARVEHQRHRVEQLVEPGREHEPAVGRDHAAFARRDDVMRGPHGLDVRHVVDGVQDEVESSDGAVRARRHVLEDTEGRRNDVAVVQGGPRVGEAHAGREGGGNGVRQEDEHDEVHVVVVPVERIVGVHVRETHLRQTDPADDRPVLHELEEVQQVHEYRRREDQAEHLQPSRRVP